MNDEILEQLSLDIDTELLKWMTTFEVHPLNLIAIILARLTWIAKQSKIEDDFIKLLESPKEIIKDKETDTTILH
jgi:hypothetical protein